MFQGETAITLDDKGRLAVPTAYRELIASACANRLVFTYNPLEHGCLWLFPHSEWEKVRDQVNMRQRQARASRPATQAGRRGDDRRNRRQRRLLVPASQRAAAGIEAAQSFWAWIASSRLWSEQAHLNKIRQTIGESELSGEMLDLRL
jgi:MraZ protein